MKIALAAFALIGAWPAAGQNLYHSGNWSAMASDRRAAAVGDGITVVVYQSAQASNTTQNASQKSTSLSGKLRGGAVAETGELGLAGGYTGRGQTQRSEKLTTQLSVTVREILPNGDLIIEGEQRMHVNGEDTRIAIRGRIRPSDIAADNSVVSTRIADAEINYDGKGFVSRSAKPGLINRLFSLLGLG